MEQGMQAPFEGTPTDDELLAGAIAQAALMLNEAIKRAADVGLRTDIHVQEEWVRDHLPSQHLGPGYQTRCVYTNCYRREDVRSVWYTDEARQSGAPCG